MARTIDKTLADILRKYGADPKTDVWDCHGTWVAYHRALERIAVQAGITFAPPQVLEANGAGKCVALCVTGTMDGRSEWSIGEAAPGNNKNGYPFAMAEKRAKDRVILKLIGLHGFIYSEDEMEDATPPKAAPRQSQEADAESADLASRMAAEIAQMVLADSLDGLKRWSSAMSADGWFDRLAEADRSRVREVYRRAQMKLSGEPDLKMAG